MKPYRLGLDLGTNSIGWSIWSLDAKEANKKTYTLKQLETAGVRIFSDGRDEKDSSLAVARREARGSRRRLRRLKRRVAKFAKELQQQGLLPPPNSPENTSLMKQDPYRLRSLAVKQELKPYELGRALFHLCQRRGYQSNRKQSKTEDKATEKEKEERANLQRIRKLEQTLAQDATLGTWLYQRKKAKQSVRFRNDKATTAAGEQNTQADIGDFYANRQMYRDEFRAIRQQQSQYPAFENINWDTLEQILFYQRPLQKPERGKCWYYEDEDRAYKSQPSSERLRIAQNVLNLRMIDEHGSQISLNNQERLQLYNKLCNCKSMTFKAIRKMFGWSENITFNLEKNRKEELEGAVVNVEMQKPEFFGKEHWHKLNLEEQDSLCEKVMLFTYAKDNEQDKLLQPFRELGLSEQQCQALFAYELPTGTTELSACLQREVLHYLLEQYPDDGGATHLQKLRVDKQKKSQLLPTLPYYGAAMPESCYPLKKLQKNKPGLEINSDEAKYGRIGNPTVHVALNQVRKVVNDIIGHYGLPDEVVVELGRDLKNSRKAKAEISKLQNENKKQNERRNKELRENYNIHYPSRDDRRKLQLYEELALKNTTAKCPYCGVKIPASDLFSPDNRVEIEHILPFSRTLDNGMANLTLSHTACNRQKGDRSPYEAFGHDAERWQRIKQATGNLPKNKQEHFTAEAMKRYESDDHFLARQTTDNAYIARKAMQYLQSICPQVWASNGHITEMLRDNLNLNSLLNENPKHKKKNRNDHRHHAIDAIVVAMIDRSLLKRLSGYFAFSQDQLLGKEAEELKTAKRRQRYAMQRMAGERQGLRQQIETVVSSIIVSHKQDHSHNSAMFAETANGLIYKAISAIDGKTLRENLPLLVRPEQAHWLLDYIATRPETNPAQAQNTKANCKKQQELQGSISELRQIAATIKPQRGQLLQLEQETQALLQRTQKGPLGKLWNEGHKAFALEHPKIGLRYWHGYFVNSKLLSGITEKDCEPLEQGYQGPVDDGLRTRLKEAYQAQQSDGDKKLSWESFIKDYGAKHGIKKVRYIPKDQTLVQPKTSSPQYYMPDGYAYCDIWRTVNGSKAEYKVTFTSYYQAQRKQEQTAPDSAEHLTRLYKNDTLYSKADGQYYLVKGYSATNDKLDIRPLIEANSPQKYKVISKIFGDEMQCQAVYISPGGWVRHR